MAVVHGAVADNQVLARDAMPAAVRVLAGLDADGVVSDIETGSGEQHILTGVDIDPVPVGGIMRVTDRYIFDGDMFAVERVQVPARRILERDAFQQNPLAISQAHQHRTQEGLDFLLVQGGIRVVERAGGGPGLGITRIRIPDTAVFGEHAAPFQDFLPQVVPDLAAFHFPPVFAAAVDDARPGNGDIRCSLRMDGREATAYVQAFEIGVDDGIQGLVRVKDNDGILVQVQADMAFEADRACAPDACGDLQRTAALLRERGNGVCKGLGVQRNPIPYGAETGQGNLPLGNGGALHPGHVKGDALIQFLFRGGRRTRAGCCKQGYCRKQESSEFIHWPDIVIVCTGANIKLISDFPCTCTENFSTK